MKKILIFILLVNFIFSASWDKNQSLKSARTLGSVQVMHDLSYILGGSDSPKKVTSSMQSLGLANTLAVDVGTIYTVTLSVN